MNTIDLNNASQGVHNISFNSYNNKYKIYGKLSEDLGVPAKYCGELYAACCRADSISQQASFIDGFVFSVTGDTICRMLNLFQYVDLDSEQLESINPSHSNKPAYYDALWAIQQAAYALRGGILAGDTEFDINQGEFVESGYGYTFINEDGYLIKGTAEDGKLASLFLGEKPENPGVYAVVRLESLLPLVGELPLGTTEIW